MATTKIYESNANLNILFSVHCKCCDMKYYSVSSENSVARSYFNFTDAHKKNYEKITSNANSIQNGVFNVKKDPCPICGNTPKWMVKKVLIQNINLLCMYSIWASISIFLFIAIIKYSPIHIGLLLNIIFCALIGCAFSMLIDIFILKRLFKNDINSYLKKYGEEYSLDVSTSLEPQEEIRNALNNELLNNYNEYLGEVIKSYKTSDDVRNEIQSLFPNSSNAPNKEKLLCIGKKIYETGGIELMLSYLHCLNHAPHKFEIKKLSTLWAGIDSRSRLYSHFELNN
jgi:hypothetical protein